MSELGQHSETTVMRKETLKRQLSVEIDKLPTEELPRVLELVGKLNAK